MEPEEAIRILQQRFSGAMLRIPLLVGNEAVNFAVDNFRRQGFLGATLEPWLSRKQGWRKDRRKGRAVLIDTGRLRRSIRIVRLTQTDIVVGTDVPYAKAHNEGSKIGVIQTVKGFTRKDGVGVKEHTRRINQNIPRRRFIGNSPYLTARIQRVARAELMKAMKL